MAMVLIRALANSVLWTFLSGLDRIGCTNIEAFGIIALGNAGIELVTFAKQRDVLLQFEQVIEFENSTLYADVASVRVKIDAEMRAIALVPFTRSATVTGFFVVANDALAAPSEFFANRHIRLIDAIAEIAAEFENPLIEVSRDRSHFTSLCI
jgi:hypothetical protein